MAQRFNVLDEVVRKVEQERNHRAGAALQNHAAAMGAQEQELARQGYGRDEIRVEQPASATGYTGPHDPACVCGRPGCNPLPAHLQTDVTLGTGRVKPSAGINEINPMTYGEEL